MKKTFDELFAEILGENVPPANNNQQQNQQQGQTTQPSTTYKATPPINKPNPQQPQQNNQAILDAFKVLADHTKDNPEQTKAVQALQQLLIQQQNAAAANKPA